VVDDEVAESMLASREVQAQLPNVLFGQLHAGGAGRPVVEVAEQKDVLRVVVADDDEVVNFERPNRD